MILPEKARADGYVYKTISGITYIIYYTGEHDYAVGTRAVVVSCSTGGVANILSTVTGTLEWTYNNETHTRNITGTVSEIASDAFRYAEITAVNFPETISHINRHVFHSCDCLTSITIPAWINRISVQAFYCCDNLKTVYLNSRNLEEPYQGKHTYDPYDDAIWAWSPIELVVIGESVESIGDHVFDLGDYARIKRIISKAITPPVLHNYSFFPIAGVSLSVPVQSLQAYKNAPIWKNFFISATGDVDGNGKVSIDDVTAQIDMLLSGDTTGYDGADVDGDGNVTIADVTALIDLLLTSN